MGEVEEVVGRRKIRVEIGGVEAGGEVARITRIRIICPTRWRGSPIPPICVAGVVGVSEAGGAGVKLQPLKPITIRQHVIMSSAFPQ